MTELTNQMSYEEAYTALQETIALLEDPKTVIEDSLALYERACKLVLYCQRKLSDYKLAVTDINTRIKKLKEDNIPLFEDEE